jgi:hypothetical protein
MSVLRRIIVTVTAFHLLIANAAVHEPPPMSGWLKQTFTNAIGRFVPLADTASLVPNDGSGWQLRHSRTTSFILLDWWTWDRPVRAEHATVARLWFKPLSTSLAVIEELASVDWHLLGRLVPALRTGDCEGFDHDTRLSD